MATKKTTIERLLADPRVHSISDERNGPRAQPGDEENGDGFWVYLNPGWINVTDGVHCIHESSPSKCKARLAETRRCLRGCECDYWDDK